MINHIYKIKNNTKAQVEFSDLTGLFFRITDSFLDVLSIDLLSRASIELTQIKNKLNTNKLINYTYTYLFMINL